MSSFSFPLKRDCKVCDGQTDWLIEITTEEEKKLRIINKSCLRCGTVEIEAKNDGNREGKM
jgi:hypothetical protein